LKSYKSHFSRSLSRAGAPLHFAAHSHHPWPDVSFVAQQQAWEDAAVHLDRKWDNVVAVQERLARGHVARHLNLSSPDTVVFAQNTHELYLRLLSCLPTTTKPKVLGSDSEFHSFSRQSRRLAEAGSIELELVPTDPIAVFADGLVESAQRFQPNFLYVSHVFFDSGWSFDSFASLIDVIDDDALVVIDGYHSFLARPVDWAPWQDRIFYLAGGYKYAMAGEGCCFMHCPPNYGARPINTGWYANFRSLAQLQEQVAYPADGERFRGSTYDPTSIYRFNAVMQWMLDQGLDAVALYRRSMEAQDLFLTAAETKDLSMGTLLSNPDGNMRPRFLSYVNDRASDISRALMDQDVITDHRNDRLRIGFSIYQDEEDIERLVCALSTVCARA
jgi:selenocysteine lyase/cysteine desulfurase